MTYEAYRLLFFISAGLSGLLLILSLVLFFVLRIPRVIGDLTGANARKAIEQIRAQNEGTGEKTYKSSAVNRARGRVTDKISESGNIMRRGLTGGGAMHTAKIADDTSVIDNSGVTDDSYPAYADTALLDQESYEPEPETYGGMSETALLGVSQPGMYGQTSLLDQSGPVFEVEIDITYVHSDVKIT